MKKYKYEIDAASKKLNEARELFLKKQKTVLDNEIIKEIDDVLVMLYFANTLFNENDNYMDKIGLANEIDAVILKSNDILIRI